MRFLIQNLFLFTVIAFLASCSGEESGNVASVNNEENKSSSSLTIKGKISGIAPNAAVVLQENPLSTMKELSRTTLKEDNTFELTTEVNAPGIYRLLIGNMFCFLALDGNENVSITADIAQNKLNNFTIEGSAQSSKVMELYLKAVETQSRDHFATYIENRNKELTLANLFAVQQIQPTKTTLASYKAVLDEVKAKYPENPTTRNFENKVKSYATQINRQPLKVGEPVPNIEMDNPEGKKMALADLKGKVVLIDFWASWCRPCRMENPNVVKVYDKYNSKGFEVFSVSLDGLDDRQAAQLQNNPSQLQQALASQKQRWTSAIQQDGLKWPYHVSELRRWSTSAVQQFGFRGIPFTVLIDRDGIVRYTNVRGPKLEEKVKELLG